MIAQPKKTCLYQLLASRPPGCSLTMDEASGQTSEAYPLLNFKSIKTPHDEEASSSHSIYYSFEKDVEAGHVAAESGKVC